MKSSRKQDVWISGLGAVTCLGDTAGDLWRAAGEDRSGINGGLGVVRGFEGENRALAFSLKAAEEALSSAGWNSLNPDDGLILATTTGLFLQWDRAFLGYVNGEWTLPDFRRDFMNQPLGELTRLVQKHFGHTGPSTLLTSACSASTQALALGAMWIREGRVKRCLVVGVEVLCDLTCEGFRSLQLLSPEPARPFDQTRKGINLSEGAAALCLDGGDPSSKLAAISGYGFSTDAYHMTGPHPEGEGSYRAMKQALQVAGLRPEDIAWVHAHGTGSQQNDLAEGLAVSRLCASHQPWVSSTKWLHGHALGASGALESVLVVRAMQEGTILSTRGLAQADPQIPVKHPPRDLREKPKHVLKNTLGFGGANASLVLSLPEARA